MVSQQDLFSRQIIIHLQKAFAWLQAYRKLIWVLMILFMVAYAAFNPQRFIHWWLTPDQHGQLLFQLKNYEKASKVFTNVSWQAYSSYGAQEYDRAAILYSQSSSIDSLLAQGNAFAHGRNYVKARAIYQQILATQADHTGAQANLALVSDIIEQTNRLSESQRAEEGESSKDLGEAPQSADGADRETVRKEVEKMSAEQLLQDSQMNEMWLRQVQKNPARFLAQKFQMQLIKNKSKTNTPEQSQENEIDAP